MSGNARILGHAVVEYGDSKWKWVDSGEEVTQESKRTRTCVRCGQLPTTDGHDACLGSLPGVRHACCGHGFLNDAYAVFEDGAELMGKDAIAFFARSKKK